MDIRSEQLEKKTGIGRAAARKIFETVPEDGAVILFVDERNTFLVSDSEVFERLKVEKEFLNWICAKIDDGQEPIITQQNNCSIIASELAKDDQSYGKLLLFLPLQTPESMLKNTELAELMINQCSQIASLVEENFELEKLNFRLLSAYRSPEYVKN